MLTINYIQVVDLRTFFSWIILLVIFALGLKGLFDLAVGCWRKGTTLYPGGSE